MIVTKDWSKYKKGDTVNIKDKTVIEKGVKLGLFEEPKQKVKKAKS